MARVTLPKVPSGMKPPSPSSVAPGSKGPKRVKATKRQPDREDFNNSAYKRARPRATLPEYLTFWVLTAKMKKKPGQDFLEQYDAGREVEGGIGAVIDFLIIDTFPFKALPVQGSRWHRKYGPDWIYDLSQFARITQRRGWQVIPLEEEDLAKDATYFVTQAVKYGRDLSVYRGKF